ncbi:MAG: hypothetical protein R3B09_12570 [Nannocystaceae bacterium]
MIEFVVLFAAVGYGAYRLVRAQGEARRYLEDSARDQPMILDHLSPTLAIFAQETRMLRLSLESPIRQVHELLSTDLTRTQGDVEAVDAALMDATRAVGEWLDRIEALPEADAQRLADLGCGGDFVRQAMVVENGSFERARLRMHGVPTLDRRLGGIVRELARIEAALQVRDRVYR